MRLSWDFGRAALAFFLHHVAIVGLFACLSHYSSKALQRRRGRLDQVDGLILAKNSADHTCEKRHAKALERS